jgi:hypothetical protein
MASCARTSTAERRGSIRPPFARQPRREYARACSYVHDFRPFALGKSRLSHLCVWPAPRSVEAAEVALEGPTAALDAFRLAARAVPRALGRAEAGRRDHLFNLDCRTSCHRRSMSGCARTNRPSRCGASEEILGLPTKLANSREMYLSPSIMCCCTRSGSTKKLSGNFRKTLIACGSRDFETLHPFHYSIVSRIYSLDQKNYCLPPK